MLEDPARAKDRREAFEHAAERELRRGAEYHDGAPNHTAFSARGRGEVVGPAGPTTVTPPMKGTMLTAEEVE